ncbi:MAG: hypothetical protein IT290_05800 [Deltaproteobacteria bacterium]|nr:hypothetical protein [Deltaproteobacteria bacterium]
MIAEGLTIELLLAALAVAVFGTVLLSRRVTFPTALIVSSTKALIPLFHFAVFNDGTWLQQDDRVYFRHALEIKRSGYNFFNELFAEPGGDTVGTLVGSEHTIYYWWNVFSFHIFGEFYHSPVFMNVILTFLGGVWLARLASRLGFASDYCNALMIFFLLHWDVIVWSSFINLKDVLVVTMTIASMNLLLELGNKVSVKAVMGLAVLFGMFSMLRHYVPALLTCAFGAYMFVHARGALRGVMLAVVAALVLYFEPWETKYSSYISTSVSPFGSIRFLLMPQFWHVEPEREGFIFVPSIFHWMMFLPMIYGGFRLWFVDSKVHLLFFYFALIVAFYTFVPELQGTRQRFQLVYFIAWMQFHALWLFVHATQSTKGAEPLRDRGSPGYIRDARLSEGAL